eukprot:Platyproteum_vivax@DN4739_c0_g1_i1.p1
MDNSPKPAAELLAKILQKKAQFYCQLAEEISKDAGLTWSAASAVKAAPKRKAGVKDPLAPRRPFTPYMIYSTEVRAAAKNANKPIPTLKDIGELWKKEKPESKIKFEEKFKQQMVEYDKNMKEYNAHKGSGDLDQVAKSPPTVKDDDEDTDEESSEDDETDEEESTDASILMSEKKRKSFEKGPETPKIPKKKKISPTVELS